MMGGQRASFGGLQHIADRLRGLPDLHPVDKETVAAWALVEAIVNAPSRASAAELFTKAASQYPVTMVVEYPVHAIVSSRDAGGSALWHLWRFYFQDVGWLRLKRCLLCQAWFVDTSKNRSTARCSDACTWKWWSRNRRKEAKSKKGGTR